MKNLLYYLGKAFQLAALITLPAAVWIANIEHNEKGCIAIFLSSLIVFAAGYGLTQAASKV